MWGSSRATTGSGCPAARRSGPIRLSQKRCSSAGPAGTGPRRPRYSDSAMTATATPGQYLLIRRLDLPPGQPHVLPVLGTAGAPGEHDLLHHHRRAPLAGGRNVQDREGRVRLGPDPGPHLERDLPTHRPRRPRPAPRRRHPQRDHRHWCGSPSPPSTTPPSAPAGHQHGGRRQRRRWPGQRRRPADPPRRRPRPGPRWPALPTLDISPIKLSIAEATRLATLAAALHPTGLDHPRPRLAFALRWSRRRRRPTRPQPGWHHYNTRLIAATETG